MQIRHMIQSLLAGLLAGAILLAGSGCGDQRGEDKEAQTDGSTTEQTSATEKKAPAEKERTVVTIDGTAVGEREFLYYFNRAKNDYDKGTSDYWTVNPEMKEILAHTALYYVQRNAALDALAQSLGVTLSDAEISQITAELEQEISYYGGQSAFESALESNGLDMNLYQRLAKLEKLEEKLLKAYIASGEIADDDSKVLSILQSDAFILCRHILLIPGADADGAQTLKRAQEVAARLAAGEDFVTLRDEYSDDINSPAEGELFCRGYFSAAPMYEDACFALPIGGSSEVIKTVFGYLIAERHDTAGYDFQTDFASLKEEYQTAALELILREKIDQQQLVREESVYEELTAFD